MSRKRTLVVHYSRTGRTRRVAELLAGDLGADLEEIADRGDRLGTVGYLRCALEGILGASTPIEPSRRLPADYDLVVVGTPVWYASVSSPVRTYLGLNRHRLPRIAFFLTHGGFGGQRVLGQMRALAGREPIGELVLREREIESGAYRKKIADFERRLRAGARKSSRSAPTPRPRSASGRDA
jgi:flavodoxin